MLSLIMLFYSAKFGDVLLPATDNWNNPFKSKYYLQQGPGWAGLGAWGQQRVTSPIITGTPLLKFYPTYQVYYTFIYSTFNKYVLSDSHCFSVDENLCPPGAYHSVEKTDKEVKYKPYKVNVKYMEKN